MKEFVDSKYMFPERAIVFQISARDRLLFGPVVRALAPRSTPEEQQGAIQKLVEEARPELKGCVVFCLNYNPLGPTWEIGVSHASLPAVEMYVELKREPLVPEKTLMQDPDTSHQTGRRPAPPPPPPCVHRWVFIESICKEEPGTGYQSCWKRVDRFFCEKCLEQKDVESRPPRVVQTLTA